MKPVKVPKVPASAYSKNRKASDLLRSQVQQLGYILAPGGTGNRLAAQAKRVKTEGQAAAFIARVTRRLHPEGTAQAAGAMAPPNAVAVARKKRAARKPRRVKPR
jgi:hypothetical protein